MSVLGRLVNGDVGKDGGSCDGDGGGGIGIVALAKKTKSWKTRSTRVSLPE